jgi:CCR4-NOT transcription complex subunit 6
MEIYILMDVLNKMNRFYHYPSIVCGDFNSLPDSAVIEFMKNNRLNKDALYEDGYKIPSENIDKLELPDTVKSQSKRYLSVSESVYGVEPSYTSYVRHFSGCIDYIFVSDDILVESMKDVNNRVQGWIDDDKFMPNDTFPSDHIDMVADIMI